MTRRYFKQSYELLPLLGLKTNSPIPWWFELAPTQVEGLVYRILPRREQGRRFHRVQVECPCCEKWLPAGRLEQHLKAHGRRT